jgi:L-ascorbate metabolism protein UlaG (beta-lactamase superfamily)
VLQPVNSGRELILEIDQTITPTPTLWWLGHGGFIFRFANITFYIDPCFGTPAGERRRMAAPLCGAEVDHADLILATSGPIDVGTVTGILESSKRAKLVLPKSSADQAHADGIPYDRMATTDSDLRIEYFRDNIYGRVYAVPSARPGLDWTPAGGYPRLGYLIRFGRWTIYHGGDGAPYEGLADRLRPFNVNVALLPIGEGNFPVSAAAQLACDIGAAWIVPMRYGTFVDERNDETHFIAHMLGQRPEQPFKVFQCGERWTVPED